MGRVLQKKKNRSSLPKSKPKNKRLKNGNRRINVLGNAIISENWDKKATLTQNYRRLGLIHRLNAPTGGVQKHATDDEHVDSLHINGSARALTKQSLGEVRVERDPDTGKIMRVVRENDDEIEVAGRKHRRANPLNDPLNDLSDEEDEPSAPNNAKSGSSVVRQLELQLAKEEELVKKKKPRHQSQREGEWISRLVERYGEDYRAMAGDRKLNPMQQTEGDLRRRIRKWKQDHS
ncbi:Nucleolar protein 16 [Monascus purpureus]|uniref:Nucleolar protein 16 n=1 Tax=Monascus purpureus TaxID=5098 RepID=A0A507QXW8_MONPU|nr:Nucleolar protein 16 [Monascus purpureus]BDD57762.1 Nucleolar protein 16 [Monascus purpureus]